MSDKLRDTLLERAASANEAEREVLAKECFWRAVDELKECHKDAQASITKVYLSGGFGGLYSFTVKNVLEEIEKKAKDLEQVDSFEPDELLSEGVEYLQSVVDFSFTRIESFFKEVSIANQDRLYDPLKEKYEQAYLWSLRAEGVVKQTLGIGQIHVKRKEMRQDMKSLIELTEKYKGASIKLAGFLTERHKSLNLTSEEFIDVVSEERRLAGEHFDLTGALEGYEVAQEKCLSLPELEASRSWSTQVLSKVYDNKQTLLKISEVFLSSPNLVDEISDEEHAALFKQVATLATNVKKAETAFDELVSGKEPQKRGREPR